VSQRTLRRVPSRSLLMMMIKQTILTGDYLRSVAPWAYVGSLKRPAVRIAALSELYGENFVQGESSSAFVSALISSRMSLTHPMSCGPLGRTSRHRRRHRRDRYWFRRWNRRRRQGGWRGRWNRCRWQRFGRRLGNRERDRLGQQWIYCGHNHGKIGRQRRKGFIAHRRRRERHDHHAP
jgi:hypothetical protein